MKLATDETSELRRRLIDHGDDEAAQRRWSAEGRRKMVVALEGPALTGIAADEAKGPIADGRAPEGMAAKLSARHCGEQVPRCEWKLTQNRRKLGLGSREGQHERRVVLRLGAKQGDERRRAREPGGRVARGLEREC